MLDGKTFGVQMVQHTKLSVKFTSHLIINCLVMLLFQQKWAHGLPMFISESTLKGEFTNFWSVRCKCPPYREVHHIGSKDFSFRARITFIICYAFTNKREGSQVAVDFWCIIMDFHDLGRFWKKKQGRRSCTPNGTKIREFFL